jgi:uncharacterized protein (DUF486 family)
MSSAFLLLVVANCFMTLAWYGHLKFLPHDAPLWQAILSASTTPAEPVKEDFFCSP